MLYSSEGKDFGQHIHPRLRRRIRIFITISAIMLAVMFWDIYKGMLGILFALVALVIGGIVGYLTSRIFHLSWDADGEKVVGRIDAIGWIVLGVYIAFEIARATFFEVVHTGYSPAAITFAFVSAALFARVLGLRGRILKVLKEEKVFGFSNE
jgi:hypothetical protein